ncbi:MAG: L,D-transpeptidase family protein [Phototrophicaceae bacterium]
MNTTLLELPIGGLNFAEAEEFIISAWREEIFITIVSDTQAWAVSPLELGLHLNAEQTIQSAQDIGFGRILFGHKLDPVVTFDDVQARDYFITLGDTLNTSPQNGYFILQEDQVVAMYGTSGSQVNVEQSIQDLEVSIYEVFETQQFELPIETLLPDMYDPQQYQIQVERFVTTPFQLEGYDPFTDTYDQWTTTPDQLITWLQADTSQLLAQSDNLVPFVDAVNQELRGQDQYLDVEEVTQAINDALAQEQLIATVQMRNTPLTYDVVSGDTGFQIARKTGIPFFLIEEANAGQDLSILSPGDSINLPSRDVTIPLPVMASKRIVVNLETQSLVAFENDEVVFSWQISSGISDAPTSPGIYQILSHEPVALGSSYTLCDDTGCGQWELNWFMGIYEVVPGLVNGFHGAVLLPNGGYLGGNNVGTPYTLGCVMSVDDQAQLLYEWAELGTVVEIISDDFAPQSDLARRVGYEH